MFTEFARTDAKTANYAEFHALKVTSRNNGANNDVAVQFKKSVFLPTENSQKKYNNEKNIVFSGGLNCCGVILLL